MPRRIKKNNRLLYAAIIGAFLAGAGSGLLYAYARPIVILTRCMFTLPESFVAPTNT